MKLKVIYGASCSGKSTYVDGIMKDDDIRFDYDLIMQSISNRESHTYSDNHLSYVIRMREMLIKKAYDDKKIKNVYIIATKLTEKLKQELGERNVKYEVMSATKEQCLKNLKKDKTRKDKGFWKKRINEWFDWYEEEKKKEKEDKERSLKGVNTINRNETREITSQKIEIRESEDGTKTITGYAIKWEKKSHVLGHYMKFREQFKKGAFADSLINGDQRFLWSHDSSKVLGRVKNDTLRLFEDDTGLRFELDLPNTTLGNDTHESIKRGDVDGVSFGFNNPDDHIEEFEDDIPLRTINKANLIEVSAVAFPAYPDSEVAARGFDRMKEHKEELEEYATEQRAKIEALIQLGGK